MVFVAFARAMVRPIRHASEMVLSTLKDVMACLVVGLHALPTRLPISEHEALSARSTISSVADLVIIIVFPLPLAITHGTSSPVVYAQSVVCQYVGYARPVRQLR